MVDRQTGCCVHYDYFSLAWARQKIKRNLNVGYLSVYGFGVFLLPFFHFDSTRSLSYCYFLIFFLFFWIGRKQSNVQHAIKLTRETNRIRVWERGMDGERPVARGFSVSATSHLLLCDEMVEGGNSE